MTTASAPATSSEHRDPLFQNTKNRIATLSSKNKEVNKKNSTNFTLDCLKAVYIVFFEKNNKVINKQKKYLSVV